MRLQAYVQLGWTPLLSIATDGARKVLEVVGWDGGTGTAPAIGIYVGDGGYVSLISDAVDISGPAGAGVAIQVGTDLITNGPVNFSNSNGVTFGITGSTITASVNGGSGGGGAVISAGTNSQSSGTLIFSNSNGVSFGLATDGKITASVNTNYQSQAAYLTTAMLSNANSNFLSVSQSSLFQQTSQMSNYQTTGNYLTTAMLSNAGSNFIGLNSALTGNGISATINSSGISLNVPAFLTTAQPVGAYLTTAMLSNAGSNFVGLNSALTGNGISATINSSGISMNVPAFLTTAQPIGAYLTTAMQSNKGSDFIGTNTALTANGVSVTANSSGLSLNFPAFLTTAQPVGAYLTTAALSNHSHAFATTTTNGANIVVATSNSNGITIAVPPYLTTAQPTGAYLTTARASNDAIGLNTALTGNGVAWTVNSSGLSLNVPAFLTTAMQSALSSNFAVTGFTTTTIAGSVIAGTHDTNGLKLAIPAFLTTAAGGGGGGAISAGTNSQNTGTVNFSNSNGVTFGLSNNGVMTASVATNYQSQGAYLTTAMLSNAGSNFIGLNSALTANGVSATINSSGISLNIPAFLTTAQPVGAYLTTAMQTGSQSQLWVMGNSSATIGGTNISGTMYSNGISLSAAAPGGGAAQTFSVSNGTISGNPITFGNLNGLTFYSSNGSIVGSYTTAAGGAGISAVIISAGITNNSISNFSFADSNNISWGINGSTITASINAAAPAYTALTYQNRQLGASGTTSGQNTVWLVPMRIAVPLSASTILQMVSITGASSTNTGSIGITYQMALYMNTAATNLSRMDSIWSSAYSITGFMSSSNSAGFTINGGASGQNLTTASANSNLGTQIWGVRGLTFNLNTILATGLYAFGYVISTSSVGNSAAIQSFRPVVDNPMPLGLGNGFGAATNNSIGYVDGGSYSVTSGAMPVSFLLGDIRQTQNVMPYVKIGAI